MTDMPKKLNATTVVVNPDTYLPEVLYAGDSVPDWAADMVGDHLTAEAGEDGYDAMKVADLKAEIASRNEGREEDALISAEGNKAALVAALEADDAAQSE